MRWITDRRGPLTNGDGERGAAAVMVALLITSLFGMAAFVIDAGALYQERRELQNGADAGALAVAEDCAKGTCGNGTTTAKALADQNSDDGTSNIDGVDIDLVKKEVTVHTSTLEGGGSTVNLVFANVIGVKDPTVHAKATAKWGAPMQAPALPLIMSKCEWDRAVGNPFNLPSAMVTVWFHDGNKAEPCNGPAGQDLPGGFGWLDATNCIVTLNVDPTGVYVTSKTGNTPTGTGCTPANFAVGTTVLIPLFDEKTGSGTNGTFKIVGYAGFEIHGITLANNGGWTAGLPCSSSKSPGAQCLVGKFVKHYVPDGVLGGPNVPDFGAITIELIA